MQEDRLGPSRRPWRGDFAGGWCSLAGHGADEPGQLESSLCSLTSIHTQIRRTKENLSDRFGNFKHKVLLAILLLLLILRKTRKFTLRDVLHVLLHLNMLDLSKAYLRVSVGFHIQKHLHSPSQLIMIIIVLSLLSCSTNYEMMRLDYNLHVLDLQ